MNKKIELIEWLENLDTSYIKFSFKENVESCIGLTEDFIEELYGTENYQDLVAFGNDLSFLKGMYYDTINTYCVDEFFVANIFKQHLINIIKEVPDEDSEDIVDKVWDYVFGKYEDLVSFYNGYENDPCIISPHSNFDVVDPECDDDYYNKRLAQHGYDLHGVAMVVLFVMENIHKRFPKNTEDNIVQ